MKLREDQERVWTWRKWAIGGLLVVAFGQTGLIIWEEKYGLEPIYTDQTYRTKIR